ncbi:MAG: bifunctional 4-hydroxy-3-methylbut-2-enyl diphosphate reductase/30S ribosomal protein S1 [Peptoniphilaceae bacterium]|nr:bifunctional 4-hydroxy-3-methylbut-2-enyl diphosphate reductase/30S ribosomal protein S1 [Peptoniphilaceae bacterium]
MKIYIANNAGFCFGVKRAVKLAEKTLDSNEKNIYSYGELIHNPQVVERFNSKGLKVIDEFENEKEGTIVLRSHGIHPTIKEKMKSLGHKCVDCTCPVLSNIYRKIEKRVEKGYEIVIVGDKNHPEIQAMVGYCGEKYCIINTKEEAEMIKNKKNLYIISQTTNLVEKFFQFSDIIKSENENVIIENTICDATSKRQNSCEELSKKVDCMIVIGGYNSSNTNKLFDVAKKYCKNVYRIETFLDLPLKDMVKYKKIGLTAGASTPDWLIEEVVEGMELLSKDEFMEQIEGSIKKIYPREVVKGTIIYVTDTEVMVNIGYRSDGIIKLDELSTDPTKRPKDLFHEGQEIDVYVIKLDDGEGNVVLSAKRVESLKDWQNLVEKFNNKELVEAEIIKEVKGGLLATVSGINAFIPASHITTNFVKDFSPYIGQKLECEIINLDERKKKIVLSRKVIEERAIQEKLDLAWSKLAVGDVLKGKVRKLTDFGAFVNLGEVDGLVHVSDISWNRIKYPSDILSVGDEIEVTILKLNRERNRISLGLKQLLKKPFELFLENNKIGDVVTGKVINLTDFGAFVKLKENVEGLVHVSQISHEHIEKASDVLSIDQEVEVKIINIDEENQKISLSIKELLPKPQVEEKEEIVEETPVEEKEEQVKFENQELDNSIGALLDIEL